MFKLIKGRNGTTPFLPLTQQKKGGSVRHVKDKTNCLTEELTEYVYKKVETGSDINVNKIRMEI